jgi:hypothetical protein
MHGVYERALGHCIADIVRASVVGTRHNAGVR